MIEGETARSFVFVMCGPQGSGKTTLLRKFAESRQGELPDVEPPKRESVHLQLGELQAVPTDLFIQVAPSAPQWLAARILALKEADGVIFVADASPGRADATAASYAEMKKLLEDRGTWPVPGEMVYNKSDLAEAAEIDALDARLNSAGWPVFRSVAPYNVGKLGDAVKELLKTILRDFGA